MDRNEYNGIIDYFLDEYVPKLYDIEFLFSFYTFLGIQSEAIKPTNKSSIEDRVSLILHKDAESDNEFYIEDHVEGFIKNHNSEISDVLRRNLSFTSMTHAQRNIWKSAHELYITLIGNEQVLPERDDITHIALVFLHNLAGKSSSIGQFVIPEDISWIITTLFSFKFDSVNKSIFDPYCQTGVLLVNLILSSKYSNISVFGYEENKKISDICKTLLCLTGSESFSLNTQNTKNKYDYVVTQIPFGNRHEGYEISKLMEMINENGCLVCVIPNGLLFRKGKDAVLRKLWVEQNQLEMIISLPENLLYHTSIPVSILVLKKNRQSKNIQLIKIPSKHDDILIGRKQNKLTDTAKTEFENALKTDKDIPGITKFVSLDLIRENDYVLNIERYIAQESAANTKQDNVSKNYLEEIRTLQNNISKLQRDLEKYYK